MVIKVRLTAKAIGFEDFQKCQKINELKKSVGGIDPVRWVIFCEQRFLSCMAFSVNEVVRVTTRLTSHANDLVNAKSHAKGRSVIFQSFCLHIACKRVTGLQSIYFLLRYPHFSRAKLNITIFRAARMTQ